MFLIDASLACRKVASSGRRQGGTLKMVRQCRVSHRFMYLARCHCLSKVEERGRKKRVCFVSHIVFCCATFILLYSHHRFTTGKKREILLGLLCCTVLSPLSCRRIVSLEELLVLVLVSEDVRPRLFGMVAAPMMSSSRTSACGEVV